MQKRALITSILLLVVGLAALTACAAQVVTTSPVQTPTLTELPRARVTDLPPPAPPIVFVPDVYACKCGCQPTPTPTPTPPPTVTLEIYDCDGEISTTWWLTSTFGAVSWTTSPSDTVRLSALWSCCGDCPAVHVVHVEDEAGNPVEGAPVILHWLQGPWLPAEYYNCGQMRGVVGYTNENGDVGFGLGPGAYYQPPAGGPHIVWIGNSSGCLSGIGMLAFTNHEHVDSGWIVAAGLGPVQAADRVFVPGTLRYTETVGGREMDVIVWPGWGWDR